MKPWYRSKVLWLNAAAGVAAAGTSVAWPDVLSSAPKWVTTLLALLWAGANVALRFVTTDGVTLRRIDKQDGFEE